eukprot:gene15957-17983_t
MNVITGRTVILLSQEGESFDVPLEIAKMSVLVIEFCQHYKVDPMEEIEKPLKSSSMHEVVDEWYANFVSVEQEVLFEWKRLNEKLAENGSCISLNNLDVLKALHFLANPLPLPCNKLSTVHGTTVCEDNLPTSCRVWSVIASNDCSGFGTLDFERFYASEKRCSVVILHFQNSNESCLNTTFREKYPRIELKRYDVWDESIDQIIFTVSYTSKTLIDGGERESENAWNIWASRELLHHYGAVSRREEAGPYRLRPLQFDHLLNQAKVSTQTSYYYITYMKIIDKANQNLNEQRLNTWKPNLKSLKGKLPTYCMVPSLKDDHSMQQWIESELKARCHPYALRKACNRARYYDGFVPCRQ